MNNVPSTSRENSRNPSESSSSIQDLLINVEANDLSSVVNEDVSITMSAPPSPATPRKIDFSAEIETPKSTGIRRRLTLKDSIGSDLENDPESTPAIRKPSRISYDERLTVICDSQTSSPLQTPSPSQERDSAPFADVFQPKGFFSFFWEELTRGYSLHNDHARFSEKRRKVYAFLRIPLELEQFLTYGLLQCIDAFFYLFTFLPLRFLMSIFGALLRIKRWTSAETCDFLKVVIIVAASMLIREIDSSFLYHQVRSQGVIKLYIFYNMLEVADRLFSSLGQDIFDALLWTANSEKRFSVGYFIRTCGHLIVAILYATLHSFLVILQATTLNVAFNSHNQTVLAIMMSNNFVELKGSVFKKFAKANLFQMACSDVRERFHIFALLFVVMIRNMTAVNWNIDSFTEMIPDIIMVVGCEYFVDWLKHAFITKFNEINAEVYKDFTITIAFDVIRSRDQSAFSDYSDQVSRRMGFIPIPLSIMIIRVLSQTFTLDNWGSCIIFGIGWLLVFAVKICNGVVMLGQACHHVKRFRDIQARAEFELFRKRMVEKKSKSAPNSPRMSLIDFTDVLHQPAAGKGFTVSDMLSQWEELQPSLLSSEIRRSTDRETAVSHLTARSDERTPRRAVSMAHIPRRDRSEPPPAPSMDQDPQLDTEDPVVTENNTNSNSEQASPVKKKTTAAPVTSSASTNTNATSSDELADVTAYKMPEQGVQRIE
ncbi:Protein TAPT1 homolog [Caenorhabditis elegans]|uniref:Protein TAPT1 homolog n=1 Tax=Caenorhabditis elegans TaxID=6239 RepID=TAPT1_CAEEL|nr:Protein TAPT1 homolog [Caenorhabditis elegans]Q9U3H8.1 RecName: Full=Protein TAPT1 homolog [Caenorhabditis elegans]CAB62802.1 Protein TAPT1 homolog [Caenorhabditis elegans]|eukprot:NP_507972.1 Protein TAPT1 homolog [Caenorhabditis elegans]